MQKFSDINDVIKYRANRIITKRIEPYELIESAKKYYNVKDYTFNGRNKFDILEEFKSDLIENSKQCASMGLYMKNVNKFYLLTIKSNPDNLSDIELLHNLLISKEYSMLEEEQISQTGIDYSTDIDYALEQIDLGKAEASFIII